MRPCGRWAGSPWAAAHGTPSRSRPTGPPNRTGTSTGPQARGKGVGSALLAHRLRVVDHSANPLAFLESTTPASRRLYERFGFEAVGSVPTLPGQSSTAMVRRLVDSADQSDRPDGSAE